MDINDQMIDQLAQLARLSFEETEKERIKGDLQKMIDFVGKLSELDTEGVKPLIHMNMYPGELRKDEVNFDSTPDSMLKNAPDRQGDYFRVPKVVKK